MTKKFKLFLSLSTITATLSPAIILISGKPKEVDPKFDTFLAQAKEETKKAIEKAVDNAIKYLEAKIKEIENEPLGDIAASIPKRLYLKQIHEFYKNNKADIINDPKKYGINAILPLTISKDKKLWVIKLTYKGREYDGVKIGESEFEDYKKQIGPDGKIEKIKEINNTLTENEFKVALKKYTDSLVSEFNNMVYQQADTPNFKVQYKLKIDTDGKPKIELEVTPPDGFTNWNDHIIKSLKPRFNEFDTKHSQETDFAQEEDDKPEKPEKVPLVPGDEPKPIERDDIDALPPLEPLIKSEYLDLSIGDLISKFNGLKATKNIKEANKFFIFNNPINTRYSYEIEELSNDSGTLKSKVKISDKVKTEKNRIYNIVIQINSSPEFKKERKILENQIDEIRINFNKLFVSLGLDEKIDYDILGNDNLQQTLFVMVEIAGKLINSKDLGQDFRKTWTENTKIFAHQLTNDDKLNLQIIKEARDNIKDLFLLTLSHSVIHLDYKVGENKVVENYNYWHSITKAYERILDQFKKSITNNKNNINHNFNSNKLKIRVLENLYEKIKRDLLKLKAESTQKNPLFVENWYKNYLNLVKEIKNEFNVLRDLATIKKADNSDTKEQKKFLEAYNKAQEHIKEQYFTQNKLKIILGSILMVIGTISTIISLLSMLIKYKTNKKRKILIIYLLILAISLALLASGITIFVLGMKGI